MNKIGLGLKGEKIVAQYLENNNFIILTQNYRTKYGEIDIIGQKEDLIVFVEVKLRNDPKFPLSDLVPYSKQSKIIKTALNYISTVIEPIKSQDKILRFDVALVEINNNKVDLNYIENAFTRKEY